VAVDAKAAWRDRGASPELVAEPSGDCYGNMSSAADPATSLRELATLRATVRDANRVRFAVAGFGLFAGVAGVPAKPEKVTASQSL